MCSFHLAEIAFARQRYSDAFSLIRTAVENLESLEFGRFDAVYKLCNHIFQHLSLNKRPRLGLLRAFTGRCTKETKAKFKTFAKEASARLDTGDPKIDERLLDLDGDKGLGLSLIIRPLDGVISLLSKFQEELKHISGDQHFYGPKEFHVAVMTLLAATQPTDITKHPIARYADVLREIVRHHQPFRIQLCGVTATLDCILFNGYYMDGTLDAIRSEIRDRVEELCLSGEIESRYRNDSAHMTVMRFRTRQCVRELAQMVRKYEEVDFGMLPVLEIELVLNDWFMSAEKVKILETFKLQGS